MFTYSSRLIAGLFATTLLIVLGSWSTDKPALLPVTTSHQVTINNNAVGYTATAGHLPVQKNNKHVANIFYTAYKLNGIFNRPVTFVFNGGPGSAALWLHMGSLAPVRVENGKNNYTNNPQTWLQFTDLVLLTRLEQAIAGRPTVLTKSNSLATTKM